jgi:hypothetical protein
MKCVLVYSTFVTDGLTSGYLLNFAHFSGAGESVRVLVAVNVSNIAGFLGFYVPFMYLPSLVASREGISGEINFPPLNLQVTCLASWPLQRHLKLGQLDSGVPA